MKQVTSTMSAFDLADIIRAREDDPETYTIEYRARRSRKWNLIPEEVDPDDRDNDKYVSHPFNLAEFEYRNGEEVPERPPKPRLRIGAGLLNGSPRVDIYDEYGDYVSHRSLKYIHAMFAVMQKCKRTSTSRYEGDERNVEGTNGSAGSFEVSFQSDGDISVGCQDFTFDEVEAFVKANPQRRK